MKNLKRLIVTTMTLGGMLLVSPVSAKEIPADQGLRQQLHQFNAELFPMPQADDSEYVANSRFKNRRGF